MRLNEILSFRCSAAKLVVKQNFVPVHKPCPEEYVKRIEDFLADKPKMLVLTGAGISTESGIPDYRSEGVGLYARTNHRPMEHMDFVRHAAARRRYWARNFVGWPTFSAKQPNSAHHALARLESNGLIQAVVTQNVDRLHTKAGSPNVVELHGSGYVVKCLSCEYRIDRHEFQNRLNEVNPEFENAQIDMVRPDGDVDIPADYIQNFRIPSCPECKGNLKPEIVFFGDSIPKNRLQITTEMIESSDGLLVLGSSLLVFSGYRMVLQAKELNLPVVIINIGPTRADDIVDIKLSAKCGDVIPKLFN